MGARGECGESIGGVLVPEVALKFVEEGRVFEEEVVTFEVVLEVRIDVIDTGVAVEVTVLEVDSDDEGA